jgi:hypothetical protein
MLRLVIDLLLQVVGRGVFGREKAEQALEIQLKRLLSASHVLAFASRCAASHRLATREIVQAAAVVHQKAGTLEFDFAAILHLSSPSKAGRPSACANAKNM